MAQNSRNNLDLAFRSIDQVTPGLKSIQSSVIRFVGAVTAGFAAIRSIVLPVTAAVEFERAMANVQKTTEFSDRQIQEFGKSVIELSKGLDTSAVELAEIAAIAGQLGLGREGPASILAFAESVARAKTTLDLTVDEAAALGAQISNIFRISTGETERIFAVINRITNTTIANASELGDIIKRIGTVAGLTFPEVAALAGVARELGTSPEVAGTSLAKIFARLQSEASSFAEILYNNKDAADEFLEALSEDRLGTFIQVLERLSEFGAGEQASLVNTLFGGGRIAVLGTKLIQDVTNEVSILRRVLADSREEYELGTSALKEYENILQATAVQWQILANIVRARSIEAGNRALDEVNASIRNLQDVISGEASSVFFDSFSRFVESSVRFVTRLIDSVVNAEVAWSNLGTSVQIFAAAIIGSGLAKAVGLIAVGFRGLTTALTGVSNVLTAGVFATLLATGKSLLDVLFSKSATGRGIDTAVLKVGQFSKALAGLALVLGRIASVFLGPVGFFALLALSFTDLGAQIGSFFGFITAEEAKAQADARRATIAQEAEIQKRIASYDAFKESIRDANAEISNIQSRRESGTSPLQLVEDLITSIRLLGEAQDAYEGANTALDNYNSTIDTNRNKISQLYREIEKQIEVVGEIEAERAKISESFERLFAEGAGEAPVIEGQAQVLSDINDELEEAKTSLDGMRAALANYQTIQDQVRRSVSSANSDIRQFQAIIQQASVLISSGLEQNVLDLITETLRYNGALEEQAGLVQDLQRLQALRQQESEEGGIVSPETLSRYTEVSNALTDISLKVRDYEKSIDSLSKEVTSDEKAIASSLSDAIPVEQAQRFARILGGLRGQAEDVFGPTKQQIVRLVTYIKALEKVRESYADQFNLTEAFATTAESKLNNLGSSITSLLADVERTIEALEGIQDQKVLDEDEERKLDKVKEKYDDLISATEAYYDRRIASGRGNIKTLEDLKQAAVEDLEAQRANEEARVRFASITERVNATSKELYDNLRDINEAAAGGDVPKFEALEDSIKQSIVAVQDFIKEQNNLFSKNIGTDRSTQIISQEQVDRQKERLRDLVKTVTSELAKSSKSLEENARLQQQSSDSVVRGYESALSEARQQLVRVLGGDDALAGLLTELISSQLESADLTEDVDSLAERIGRNLTLGLESKITDIPDVIAKNIESGPEQLQKAIDRVLSALDANNVLTGLGDRVNKTISDGIVKALTGQDANKLKLTANEDFLANNLNTIINSETFLNKLDALKIRADLVPSGGAQRNARGGLIRGPGTGRSDSILSWLSNGEYVMDSFTTGFFGSGFFKTLQDMARAGLRLPVPKFRDGGPVSGFSPSGGGNMDVVEVRLNIGGNQFPVFAGRGVSDALVRELKNQSRGSIG